MRLFFQRESNKKSAKPIIVIRILMVVTMGIFFVSEELLTVGISIFLG